MWGDWAAPVVAVAVVISSLGALNGWTLLMGQVPMAAADDQLFPSIFGRRSARGVPAIGIMVSALLASALILVGATGDTFASIYALIVGLATMTAAIPYAFCAVAGVLIAAQAGLPVRITAVEAIAFVFSVFVVYGCGPEPVLYGLVMLLLGIPVYVWQRRDAAVAAEPVPEVALPLIAGRLR